LLPLVLQLLCNSSSSISPYAMQIALQHGIHIPQ